MKKILITGTTGLLAPYLIKVARSFGEVITTSRSAGDIAVDLSNDKQVSRLLTYCEPDWIVHAAGMTDVDGCERNPQKAFRDNQIATRNLVESVSPSCHVVLLSTDQVYPDTPGLHDEPNTAPVNTYGRSKLAGENATENHGRVTILRTSFFGRSLTLGRSSLDDFVIGNLIKRKKIKLFSDVRFSPLHMTTLSEVVFELLEKKITGLFNLGSRQGMSKADFAFEIARRCKVQTETAEVGVSTSVAGRTLRPKDLRMNVKRIEGKLGRNMPTLMEEIYKQQ